MNKTLKNNSKHKTAKSGNKSRIRFNANEYKPNTNNVTSHMTSLQINNSMNYMSLLAAQMAAMREKIGNAVAIDCEMVGIGYDSALAHIAIVDFNGNEIYNKYVIPKSGIRSITNYRTNYSGITPKKLELLNRAMHSFEIVKQEVHKILKGKIVVGHGLINDFKVLEFEYIPHMIWDTTLIDVYLQTIFGVRRPRKLKVLAKEFANNNIQKVNRAGHSPLEDARASMNLYRLAFGYPKVVYANMSSS